jgi:macrolide transport system ATP-binding/permease protein
MLWWRRLIGRWRRSRFERDLAAELQFHLDERAGDLVSQGLGPHEARRRASVEFGGFEGYKENCREAAGWMFLSDLRADLTYGLRRLRQSPGFAAAAILSLALGVGANTLVFSVVNSLLLRPLPVARPQELFFLQSDRGPSHSFPLYRDLRDRAGNVASLAGYRISPMNLVASGDHAVRIWGYLATGNYFTLLGVTPAYGRFFGSDEDRLPGGHPVAVLSHECFRARFLGDPDIVGRPIAINGHPYTVLGIAPPGFHGTERFYHAEIWVPMMMQEQIEPGNPWLERRNTSNTFVVGRAKTGISFEQIASAINIVAADVDREQASTDRTRRYRLTSPGLIGDALGAPVRAFTFGVQALAGFVLLVACLNLAGVLSSRGADRARELAIRLSIGARRPRIIRQLLTESLLLSAFGGVAGVALAFAGARLVSAWRAPVGFPIALDVTIDLTVLLFGVAVSTVATITFGVAPARQAARTDPNTVLKSGSVAGSSFRRRRWSFQDALVAMQITLCCALVAACFLSLEGLRRALTMPLGFNPRGVTMAGADLGLSGYDQARGQDFQRRALDALRHLPGVESVAYANSVPLSIDQSRTQFRPVDQQTDSRAEPVSAIYYQVSPAYFATMGTRLLSGREFDWHDDAGAPRVAIVNGAFARAVIGVSDPVGRRVQYGRDRVEIVGLVEDGKYEALSELIRPVVFWAAAQSYNSTTTLLVRSTLPEDQVVRDLQQAVSALDPALPVYGAGSLTEMLRFALLPSRAAAAALVVFGVLAMTLAAVGIHGVVAYAVARRRREIGIRIAIGAGPAAVLRLVLGRMGWLIGLGAAVGLALVFAGANLLQSIVLEASPRDPKVIGAVILSIVLLAGVACWSPARRAAKTSSFGFFVS